VTLILSHITRDYVLQVSDRRLVSLPDLKPKHDDATKAVLYGLHTTFGYTGLAHLRRSAKVCDRRNKPGEPVATHMWLVEVLNLYPNSLEHALVAIQEEMNFVTLVSYLPKHAFIGVGWIDKGPGTPIEPAIHEIANIDSKFQRTDRFQRYSIVLQKDQPFLTHWSSPGPEKIVMKTARLIRRRMRRGGAPSEIAGILREAVREVAKEDTTVGRGVLVTCVPKKQALDDAAGKGWSITAVAPNLESFSFLHFPAKHEIGLAHGPAIAIGENFAPKIILEGNARILVGRPTPPPQARQ